MPATNLPPMTMAQGDAVERILDFAHNSDKRTFLLAGYAGTGKTFCLQHLVRQLRGRAVFTAPTNKATRVLRDTLAADDYKPECKTIYSLLGLRLEPNGEVKELSVPEEDTDLSAFRLAVVDEASMVNAQLLGFIKEAIGKSPNVKFLFLGDPAQLPPVKETRSPVWEWAEDKATLTEVVRNAGPILEFVTSLRKIVDHPAPNFKVVSNNDGESGIWKLPAADFKAKLAEAANLGRLSAPGDAKVIAWRNVTVDAVNRFVRAQLFNVAAEAPWLVGDRVVLTEPATDLENKPMAPTDEEGTITRVEEQWHPTWSEFKVWRINITSDSNLPLTFFVLHQASEVAAKRKLEDLAAEARVAPRKWGAFWEFKDAFHKLRHSYAITAHRSQGSTYNAAFVNWQDILLNRNKPEAMRCLYVACSRPKKELYLG